MSQIGNAKMLGGIGAILMLLGWLAPTVGFIIVLVGLVLIFIGVKYIADETKNHAIFKNYLLHFIFTIISICAIIGVMLLSFASVGGMAFFQAFQDINMTDPTEIFNYFAPMLVGCLVAFIIGWIFIILGALFLKKSYDQITEQTKVPWFKTTALVYLIGAFTLIIVIGAFIIFIAKILEIVAFFSLPDTLSTTPTPQPQTQAPQQ